MDGKKPPYVSSILEGIYQYYQFVYGINSIWNITSSAMINSSPPPTKRTHLRKTSSALTCHAHIPPFREDAFPMPANGGRPSSTRPGRVWEDRTTSLIIMEVEAE